MTRTLVLAGPGCPAPYLEAVTSRLVERGHAVHAWSEAALPSSGVQGVALIMCGDDWSELERAVADDGIVVAILARLEVDDYVRALVAGADGVVYADTTSAITADVIEAAMDHEVLLPASAAQEIARRAAPSPRPIDAPSLDDADLELLRLLAGGVTLVDAAGRLHYSERTLRRRLQNICLRLEVTSRSEAIALAARRGWID